MAAATSFPRPSLDKATTQRRHTQDARLSGKVQSKLRSKKQKTRQNKTKQNPRNKQKHTNHAQTKGKVYVVPETSHRIGSRLHYVYVLIEETKASLPFPHPPQNKQKQKAEEEEEEGGGGDGGEEDEVEGGGRTK